MKPRAVNRDWATARLIRPRSTEQQSRWCRRYRLTVCGCRSIVGYRTFPPSLRAGVRLRLRLSFELGWPSAITPGRRSTAELPCRAGRPALKSGSARPANPRGKNTGMNLPRVRCPSGSEQGRGNAGSQSRLETAASVRKYRGKLKRKSDFQGEALFHVIGVS